MKEIESNFPPGLIGVPIGALARYPGLYVSLDRLHVPKHSELLLAEGANVAHNCNVLVENLKPHHEWLWLMGDDHRFQADILLSLLARDVDIVAPVVSRRGYPFQTVMYKIAEKDGAAYLTYSWADLSREFPDGGLIMLEAVGSAGMLIKKHVFTNTPSPWFTWKDKISEDIGFCLLARQYGFNIYVDLDQRMTHTTLCELEPYRTASGEWNVAVVVDGRKVSLTNTPHDGKDLREVCYGFKEGRGVEFSTKPEIIGS